MRKHYKLIKSGGGKERKNIKEIYSVMKRSMSDNKKIVKKILEKKREEDKDIINSNWKKNLLHN